MPLRIRPDQISRMGATLTMRERQVLKRICLEQPFQQIAASQRLSRISIWRIQLQIYGKLGVADRHEFRELAYEKGWMQRPKVKPIPEPVVYKTVEGAAGPQARFMVGTTTGDYFFRFHVNQSRRKYKQILAGVDSMRIELETTLGWKKAFDTELRNFRRVWGTYAQASDASLPYRLIQARVVKFGKHGYLIATKPHTPAAATYRLDQYFVMEHEGELLGPPAFHFLLNPKPDTHGP